MERHEPCSIYELLQRDRYTPAEVADLLGIDRHVVSRAAFSGELRARIVGHHIVSLRRDDVIAWLDERAGTGGAAQPIIAGQGQPR